MDLLKNNLNLYDIKKQVRKAQNVVYKYSTIESKVREATNNEPFNVTTIELQEIAQASFNYKERKEILNLIYKRFTDKSATKWRQIYKSLILLDYLIKNGAEEIIYDAKNNIHLLTMLQSFYYIDYDGSDKGSNVRNKAKAIVNVLSDEQRTNKEREKARDNFNKINNNNISINSRERRRSRRGKSNSISFSNDYPSGGFFDHEDFDFGTRDRIQFDDKLSPNNLYDPAYDKYDTKEETNNDSKISESSNHSSTVQDLFSFDDVTPKDKDEEFEEFQSVTASNPSPLLSPISGSTKNDLFAAFNNNNQNSFSLASNNPNNNPNLFNLQMNQNPTNVTNYPKKTYRHSTIGAITTPTTSSSSGGDAFSSLFNSAKTDAKNHTRKSSLSH